jgi:hypothetical protein
VAASMALGKDTSSCWVYTQPDCSGPYTVVSNVAKFPNSPSGVTSFQWFVHDFLSAAKSREMLSFRAKLDAFDCS